MWEKFNPLELVFKLCQVQGCPALLLGQIPQSTPADGSGLMRFLLWWKQALFLVLPALVVGIVSKLSLEWVFPQSQLISSRGCANQYSTGYLWGTLHLFRALNTAIPNLVSSGTQLYLSPQVRGLPGPKLVPSDTHMCTGPHKAWRVSKAVGWASAQLTICFPSLWNHCSLTDIQYLGNKYLEA